jgi:hypothetical protein
LSRIIFKKSKAKGKLKIENRDNFAVFENVGGLAQSVEIYRYFFIYYDCLSLQIVVIVRVYMRGAETRHKDVKKSLYIE